jgi:hypothetical protein
MEAKELRIGNIICYKNKATVTLDLSDFNEICQNEEFLDFISPVALTEDWLLKFGFEKNINKDQIDGIEMHFQIDDKTYFSSCGKLGGGLVVLCLCRGNYFANNLEYVHQLQNLCFALSGEELELVKPAQ